MLARPALGVVMSIALGVAVSAGAGLQQQTPPPVPRPFPQSGAPPPAPTPTTAPGPTARPPAAPPAGQGVPTEVELGVKLPPTADFLESVDAGRGQRYYLFGTNDAYADVVTYFRNLRLSGRELFRAPAMQQFDLARFDDRTMAFPPSVVVKDYALTAAGAASDGYLHIDGLREKRYKTIIQVVPGPK